MRSSAAHVADVDFGAMGSPFSKKTVRQLIVDSFVLGFQRSIKNVGELAMAPRTAVRGSDIPNAKSK